MYTWGSIPRDLGGKTSTGTLKDDQILKQALTPEKTELVGGWSPAILKGECKYLWIFINTPEGPQLRSRACLPGNNHHPSEEDERIYSL